MARRRTTGKTAGKSGSNPGSKLSRSKTAASRPVAPKPAPSASPQSEAPKNEASQTEVPQSEAREIAATPATPAPPVIITQGAPVTRQPALKKQELVEQVIRRSGIRKRDAKPVIEALLAVLGEAAREGREMNLEPLGKLKINRVVKRAGAQVSVLKLRQKQTAASAAQKDSKDPLAPTAE